MFLRAEGHQGRGLVNAPWRDMAAGECHHTSRGVGVMARVGQHRRVMGDIPPRWHKPRLSRWACSSCSGKFSRQPGCHSARCACV
eukprot:65746-Chlamydomonas_euryale.AAC.1